MVLQKESGKFKVIFTLPDLTYVPFFQVQESPITSPDILKHRFSFRHIKCCNSV